MDLFVDVLASGIMQFRMPFETLGFELKVAFSLAVSSKFLFLNILQGQVISFAHESRIPSSDCVYSTCRTRSVEQLENLTFTLADPVSGKSDDPRNSVLEPTEYINYCEASSMLKIREGAQHSQALGNT